MNITVSGIEDTTIVIDPYKEAAKVNPSREAALIVETLYWNLAPDVFNKLVTYITKKVIDLEVETHVKDINAQGHPAISVVYPTGSRAVMTEDEMMELYNSQEADEDDEDENDGDYGLPEE